MAKKTKKQKFVFRYREVEKGVEKLTAKIGANFDALNYLIDDLFWALDDLQATYKDDLDNYATFLAEQFANKKETK